MRCEILAGILKEHGCVYFTKKQRKIFSSRKACYISKILYRILYFKSNITCAKQWKFVEKSLPKYVQEVKENYKIHGLHSPIISVIKSRRMTRVTYDRNEGGNQ
jgi:patatin-like phospholipase/acyl hydrolase